MEKVLVTGGLGFIGSHVVVGLKEKGYDVLIIDNLSNSSIDVLSKIEKLTSKPSFIQGDIRDRDFLDSVFSKEKIDIVMHFAALKSVGESQKYPQLYHDVNVQGTLNLLDMMEKHNIRRFVYSSSATVYGSEKAPVSEESKTGVGLTCNYARNKYDIEQHLRKMKNMDITILRYFNPLGAHPSGLLGENPNDIPNNIFPYLLRCAQYSNSSRQEEVYKQFTIYGDDYPTEDGTCIRDYIHVQDLARAHIDILAKMKELQIYNVGTGKGTSVRSLVQLFNQCLVERGKNPIQYRVGQRREGDIDVSYADVSKIKREIGFQTLLTVKDMCIDGLRFSGL